METPKVCLLSGYVINAICVCTPIAVSGLLGVFVCMYAAICFWHCSNIFATRLLTLRPRLHVVSGVYLLGNRPFELNFHSPFANISHTCLS